MPQGGFRPLRRARRVSHPPPRRLLKKAGENFCTTVRHKTGLTVLYQPRYIRILFSYYFYILGKYSRLLVNYFVYLRYLCIKKLLALDYYTDRSAAYHCDAFFKAL